MSDLVRQLQALRDQLAADDAELRTVRAQLAPYWERVKLLRERLITSFQSEWYSRPRMTVASMRWVGPSKGGHVEPCERVVIHVQGRDHRRMIFAEWVECHEQFRPLIAHHRELKAETDAAIRAIDRTQLAIANGQEQSRKTRKERQLSLWSQ